MVLEGQTELIRALAIAIFSTWPFAKKNHQRLSSVTDTGEMKAIVVLVKRC